MKVLLLSNKDNRYLTPVKEWIDRGMKKALDSRSRHRPLSVNPDDLLIIKSLQDYDEASFKAFFKEDSGTYYVVIVPELNWDVSAGFEAGYEKALDLLGDKLGNKFFHLFFVSFLHRNQLFQLVGPEYQELAGAGAGPKGLAVRQSKRYVSWVQNVARQFGPYLLRALDACGGPPLVREDRGGPTSGLPVVAPAAHAG